MSESRFTVLDSGKLTAYEVQGWDRSVDTICGFFMGLFFTVLLGGSGLVLLAHLITARGAWWQLLMGWICVGGFAAVLFLMTRGMWWGYGTGRHEWKMRVLIDQLRAVRLVEGALETAGIDWEEKQTGIPGRPEFVIGNALRLKVYTMYERKTFLTMREKGENEDFGAEVRGLLKSTFLGLGYQAPTDNSTIWINNSIDAKLTRGQRLGIGFWIALFFLSIPLTIFVPPGFSVERAAFLLLHLLVCIGGLWLTIRSEMVPTAIGLHPDQLCVRYSGKSNAKYSVNVSRYRWNWIAEIKSIVDRTDGALRTLIIEMTGRRVRVVQVQPKVVDRVINTFGSVHVELE